MLDTLKRFSLAIIISIVVNIGAFSQLGEFVSLGDIVWMLAILLGADALLIILIIKDFLRNKK